ncbi:MAG: D-sedoheptulose 7-phosphate isomerase [Luteibaculaceae bacterium]|jgi:D-sedoheptulose 7-phosphate isomerase
MGSIREQLEESLSVLEAFLATSPEVKIAQAGDIMVKSLQSGGKILACGNGGSMCDAMHFCEELTGRYRENRKAIPAIALSDVSHISCVGNDYGFDSIFSRGVEAFGKPEDTLVAISTSGNSANVIKAIEAAKKIGMSVICLTGKDGGKMKDLGDLEIRAPKTHYADRAQEIHIKVIHNFIFHIEKALFG